MSSKVRVEVTERSNYQLWRKIHLNTRVSTLMNGTGRIIYYETYCSNGKIEIFNANIKYNEVVKFVWFYTGQEIPASLWYLHLWAGEINCVISSNTSSLNGSCSCRLPSRSFIRLLDNTSMRWPKTPLEAL